MIDGGQQLRCLRPQDARIDDGFIDRVVSPKPPVRIRCEPTDAGRSAAVRLAELAGPERQVDKMSTALAS